MHKIPLFEFLSEPVELPRTAGLTRISEAEGEDYDRDLSMCELQESSDDTRVTFTTETYDDDASVSALQALLSEFVDMTRKTTIDGETYDDDPGVDLVAAPATCFASTVLTRVEGETYDDDQIQATLEGHLASLVDGTILTKVDGETYDDDGLGVEFLQSDLECTDRR